jgi:hypothetical protein
MATHGHSHHPAAPAAPATPPPPQWQPLNWSFPFVAKRGNAADPQTWLYALAGADGGFFPLGANGMFHGGIHFDPGTGGDLKQEDGVKVIADGEVVAYRLDSTYPELTYPTTPPHYALYSTSFVLVRHELVLPPAPENSKTAATPTSGGASSAPAAGASEPQGYQPPADEVLVFYSLYMHQLDWTGYKAAQAAGAGSSSAPSVQSMPYWQGDKVFRVGSKANDRQAQPPQLNTRFRFDLDAAGGDTPTPDNGAALESIAAGPSPDSLGALVPLGDQKLRYGVPSATASDIEDPPKSAEGARIFDRVKGKTIGLLPRGSELVVVGNAKTGWAQIAGITTGTPVAAVAGGTPDAHATTGWVNLDALDTVIDPKPLDSVVVLDTPFKVKAGDVVGYLGEYTTSLHAQKLPPTPAHPLLHVEVFTGASIKKFITKSKERASKLPDSGKTLLVIQTGAKLNNPVDVQGDAKLTGLKLVLVKGDSGKGNWARVQPTQMSDQATASGHGKGKHTGHAAGISVGSAVWVERKYAGQVANASVQSWASFPLQSGKGQGATVAYQQALSRAQLDAFSDADKAVDAQNTQWWSIAAGDSEGKTISGWVCETNHPDTQWQSPWSWPDFDTVDTTDIPVLDFIRRTIYEKKQLFDGEEQEFSVSATKVNAGLLIAKLAAAAKRQGGGAGHVVPADLKRALTVPWLAEAISHLIVRYESEWGGDMSKWEKLLSVMGDAKPIWKSEMERINKLQWWNQVKAVKSFPTDADVWHIHPIGLVGNFIMKSQASSHVLTLTKKDVLDLKKTLQTEWIQWTGEMQAKGVVDTILNRVASGRFGSDHHFGNTVSDVVNQYNQFSDINGPIARNQHGRSSVDQFPVSDISKKVSDFVDSYLGERANGADSSVGTNLNYANPFFSDEKNRPWINALDGPRYGRGNAIHYHGTTPGLERYRPEPYSINLDSE